MRPGFLDPVAITNRPNSKMPAHPQDAGPGSLGHERARLHARETGPPDRQGIQDCMGFHDYRLPYSALGGIAPVVIYWQRIDRNQPDL